MKVDKIMCCCGSGIGSSMLVDMNANAVLKEMGLTGIQVSHTTLSEVRSTDADLFIVGNDLKELMKKKGVSEDRIIVLMNIVDKKELEEKLRAINIEH